MSLLDFNHVLLLSERESLCSIERYSLRQLGVSFIQSYSSGQQAIDLIRKNNHGFNKNFNNYTKPSHDKNYKSRLNNISTIAGEDAATYWESSKKYLSLTGSDFSKYPVDLILCTERLEDSHVLDFLAQLRGLSHQANIAVMVFPDSTRCWREAEKLMACCMSRPYTLNEFHTKLLRAKYLAQNCLNYKNNIAHACSTLLQKNLTKQKNAVAITNQELAFASIKDDISLSQQDENLGLAKPEPIKREPFPLIDENDWQALETAFKREPFPLVDDFEDENNYMQSNRLKRKSFSLVEDSDINVHQITSFKTTDNTTQTVVAYNNDEQKTEQKSLYAFTVAQELLQRGFYVNAAQAFLSCYEIIVQQKKVERVIYSACQYTAAPKDNLEKMCNAMQLIGEKTIAKKLEKVLHEMYGLTQVQNTNTLGKKFPILSEVLSVAFMTVSMWRSPNSFNEYNSI